MESLKSGSTNTSNLSKINTFPTFVAMTVLHFSDTEWVEQQRLTPKKVGI